MLHKTNDIVKQVTGDANRKVFKIVTCEDYFLFIKFKGNGSKCGSFVP